MDLKQILKVKCINFFKLARDDQNRTLQSSKNTEDAIYSKKIQVNHCKLLVFILIYNAGHDIKKIIKTRNNMIMI